MTPPDALQVVLYPTEASRVTAVLLQIARIIERRLEEGLEEVDLSVPKYSAIKHLALAGEPLAFSDLASRMVCVRSNITQLMGRLEADGLVQRVEDPKDRRSVRAALTPLGKERQAAGAEKVRQVQAKMAETLGELDREAMERVLEKLK